MMTSTDKELVKWSAKRFMGYSEYFVDPSGIGHCKDRSGNWLSWNPLGKSNGQIWDVMERMRELEFSVNLHEHPFMEEKKNKWSASFRNLNTKDYFEAYADNPRRAILLAAWRAVEEKP